MLIPLLSRFKKTASPETILLVDLGTAAIKATAVGLPQALEEHPKVLGSTKHPLGRQMMRGRYIRDLDGVLASLSQAIDQVSIHSEQQPEEMVLGLSGTSVQYVGLTIRVARAEPEQLMEQKELDEIVRRVEEETLNAATQKAQLPDKKWSHLGVIVTDYWLDGKLVETPLGLPGTTLECTILHGFWPDDTQETVDMLSQQLGIEISMVWETAVARALRTRGDQESFILIDIGGQATEIVLVRNRRIVKNASFNIGSEDWTEHLAKSLQLKHSQAEKVKHSLQEGLLDQQRAMQAKEALEDVVGEFIQYVASAVVHFDDKRELPPLFYFTGEGSRLDVVKSKVLTFPWTKETTFSNFPHIERVEDSYLNESLYYGYDLLS